MWSFRTSTEKERERKREKKIKEFHTSQRNQPVNRKWATHGMLRVLCKTNNQRLVIFSYTLPLRFFPLLLFSPPPFCFPLTLISEPLHSFWESFERRKSYYWKSWEGSRLVTKSFRAVGNEACSQVGWLDPSPAWMCKTIFWRAIFLQAGARWAESENFRDVFE